MITLPDTTESPRTPEQIADLAESSIDRRLKDSTLSAGRDWLLADPSDKGALLGASQFASRAKSTWADLMPSATTESTDVLKEALPSRPGERIHNFLSLQSWEGFVTSVGTKEFAAEIRDTNNRNNVDEVILPIEELSESDLELLREGALFSWSIGYLIDYAHQKQTTSRIRFRRILPLDEFELIGAEQRGRNLYEAIKAQV